MLIRTTLALGLGLIAGLLSWWLQVQGSGSDFTLPHCAARRLLAGGDPYSCPTGGWPSNPMTTVLALLPFARLPLELAGATIMGLSSGLLAHGLLRTGEPWRLLTFSSWPYVYALFVAQWSPLILAIAFVPVLYPLLLVKPHLGLAPAVLLATPRRVLGAGLYLGLSFVVMPGWPWAWWPQARGYDGFVPLLLWPAGPLLLAALLRWRDPGTRWLVLLSLTPQRIWHDQLLIYSIPRSRPEMLVLVLAGWAMWLPFALWRDPDPRWVLALLYLPALALVLARPNLRSHLATAKSAD